MFAVSFKNTVEVFTATFQKVISLYFIGQSIGLLHAEYSQCFDPKTLIINNFENFSFPGFRLLTDTGIGQCMMVCYKFTLCRSVDWMREEKTCRLNTRFATQNYSDIMTHSRSIHVDREHIPKHVTGFCLNHACAENAMCIRGECVPVLKAYKDCSDILKKDKSKKGHDGVYVIHADIWREVYCDLTTDGGGWTVIQKREDGDVDFYRTWIEYKEGFGNAIKNYWIGNDAIHTLTKDKNQELRVDLQSFSGEQAYAVYSTFYIGDENNKYILTVPGYSGTAGDSLTWHSGSRFSTKDQDNDYKTDGSCAVMRHGAWWYSNCLMSNLNGEYAMSVAFDWNHPVWEHWRGSEAMKKTVMMIRNKI